MNNGSNIPNVEPGIPSQNAISVYGQADGMDDFPVLKAFQQYVDAEQAKAQKRMTTLCVFFAIILTIVVGVFVALLLTMSNAKNDSNDKLIQYMLQERERQHSLAAQGPLANPQNDAAFKALTDTVTSLQKQLADQQLKMIEEKQKAAEEAVKRAAEAAAAQVKVQQQTAEPPSPAQLEMDKKNQATAEKIAKATEQLKKQKEELAKEKERLHQQEVELQRRRLYPEYYQKLEDEKKAPAAKPVATSDGSRRYFDEDDDDEDLEEDLDSVLGTQDVAPAPKKPAPAAKSPSKPKPAPAKPVITKPTKQADGSIRYFSEDDEDEAKPVKTVPVQTKKAPATNAHDALLSGKGASSGWTIPLE